MTKPSQILTRLSAVLALGLFTAGFSGEAAAACTAIGSSTYCGTRGSHNTVGRTVIFNNGRAGQRIGGAGGFVSPGFPSRPTTVIGGRNSALVGPRTFRGVATPRSFSRGATTDSAIARLRAEILANEAQAQLRAMKLQQLGLTPAQEAAQGAMSPALMRALTLAKAARAEADDQSPGETEPATN